MNCRAARSFAFLVLFFVSLVTFTGAQDKNRATADENIDLNIAEERVTETNFERSTTVEVADNGNNLTVRVGASARAQTIDITLRGIQANGRFRASLEKITRLLERGRQNP